MRYLAFSLIGLKRILLTNINQNALKGQPTYTRTDPQTLFVSFQPLNAQTPTEPVRMSKPKGSTSRDRILLEAPYMMFRAYYAPKPLALFLNFNYHDLYVIILDYYAPKPWISSSGRSA